MGDIIRTTTAELEELYRTTSGEAARIQLGPVPQSLAVTGSARCRVVFVARTPYYQILREALHLRRLGYQVILISLTPLSDAMRDVFGQTFEQIFQPMAGLEEPGDLLGSIRRLGADILHVQCWMLDYALARLILENRGRAKCVCEFYDVTSVVAERDVLASEWPPSLVDLDLHSEAYICREADAIICRYPTAVADELRERHGGLTRFLEMYPYPCAEFHGGQQHLAEPMGSVPRLVYAGAITPDNGLCPAHLHAEIHQLATFERLLRQGLSLDVLIDPGAPVSPDHPSPGYEGYFDLVRRYPRYAIRNGCAPGLLAQILSRYDFGVVNLTTFDLATLRVRPSLRKYAVGTKLFTYLESGLPVLVYAEYEQMAAIVSDHGLGLVLHSAELDNVAEKIRVFDYRRAVDNVRRFNEEHAMSREISRLTSLYHDLLGTTAPGALAAT